MRWAKSSFVLLVGVAAVGSVSCSDGAASKSLSPSSTSLTPLFNDVQAKGDQQEVTGGVSFFIPEAPGVNTPAQYEMAAIRHRDGRVTGELVLRVSRSTEQFFWGDIVCFSTVGKTAFLAAKIRKTNVSFLPPEAYFTWTVVDNGEGKKDAPDQTSTFMTVDEHLARANCDVGALNLAVFPVVRGNIQVHESH